MLQASLSCHFSVQFLHLVISITDKCTVTIESQYLKFFVMLQLPLMSFVSTTTLQGNTHWLSKSHLLKIWDILSHVINTALLHTCLMYWLSFKTDHDRLLAILAKYILSREIYFDIWLTINLRGKKDLLCLSWLPANLNEKDYSPSQQL